MRLMRKLRPTPGIAHRTGSSWAPEPWWRRCGWMPPSSVCSLAPGIPRPGAWSSPPRWASWRCSRSVRGPNPAAALYRRAVALAAADAPMKLWAAHRRACRHGRWGPPRPERMNDQPDRPTAGRRVIIGGMAVVTYLNRAGLLLLAGDVRSAAGAGRRCASRRRPRCRHRPARPAAPTAATLDVTVREHPSGGRYRGLRRRTGDPQHPGRHRRRHAGAASGTPALTSRAGAPELALQVASPHRSAAANSSRGARVFGIVEAFGVLALAIGAR